MVKLLTITIKTSFILGLSFFTHLLLAGSSAHAQEIKIQNMLDAFVNQDIFKSANIGIELCNLRTGEVLAAHNSEKSLTPASTQKLITTAAALEILGSDFQFSTKAYITGEIDEKRILKGNLIIQGLGDPTLGSKYFPNKDKFISSVCSEIKKLGIRQVKGQVLADQSYYQSTIPRTWIWEDIGNYYGAVPHSISYKDNTYTIHFESKEAGRLTQIKKVDNKPFNLKLTNKVMASTINKDRAYIFGGTTSSQRNVEGTIPENRSNFKVKGALSRPELVLLKDLKSLLTANEIPIKNEIYQVKNKKIIIHFKSPPLSDIIALTNLKSINLFADHLLFQIGIHRKNEGSWQAGILAIKEFWQSQGIDSKALFLHDGSGLSHFNAVSAHALNQILMHMSKSQNSNAFFNSLPISGKMGTLKNFGKQSPLINKFKAKTGSMTAVRSYSGLLTKNNGQDISISLIINNYTCTSQELSKSFKDFLIKIANL